MCDVICIETYSSDRFALKIKIKFCLVHFSNMLKSMTSCLSAVFNSLVLLCIREIDGALQKILNLKMDKDQKKYRTIM